jgi:tRNA threonylcarbamoyl adenosine modification protein YeaZ
VLAAELGPAAHARDLVPELERLLSAAGVERRDGKLALGAVIAGLGPGSYTGLRVGIATAQALARATGAALFGLPSFEALAFAELTPGQEGTVAMDARAGRFTTRRAGSRPLARPALDLERGGAGAALRARECPRRRA